MNDMVRISRGEYDRLLQAAEELDDLRAYDRAIGALASGAEEQVPAGSVSRILAGESPLRVFRELRGLSQVALAGMSGVNRVQIGDIEAGRKTGSIETVRKLAEALRVAIDDLV
jgi:mRNA interferase RelE/StbE